MIDAFRRSIGRKLMLVVLAATIIALLASAIALLWYDARTYRETWRADLAAQADILARASAPALAFLDRNAAQENLRLLSARPNILAGAIYTPAGELFASYVQPDSDPPPRASDRRSAGSSISGDNIVVYKEIMEESELLGMVYLRGRFGPKERLGAYAKILAAVMLGSLLLAAAITLWLQKSVTRPIVDLTDTARSVIGRRDFSLRADKNTQDEVGVLVDAFNAMLAEVERNAGALREADRLKDEFLATLAHELRNPLAPMSNGLELLRVASSDPDKLATVREMMQRQLSQMVRLVDDLLDVSRITTGRLAIRKESVDLHAVIASAIEIARPLVDTKAHRLTLEIENGPLMVDGDATRLAQVYSNLLNNAARYTPPDGVIVLRARRVGKEIEIAVSDTGIGLTAESLKSVFGMFVQVDTSLERANAGLGVGLSLARRLVELHGGSITAHSDGPGCGSVFTVRLPISAGSPSKQIAPGLRPVASGASRRILLADDNVDFITGFEMILRQQGHEVRVAHDGVAALELAQTFRPEFAFLDIGLPGVNGYDLADRLRDSPMTAECVLTAVTGWGQRADRERARSAGFDFHCVKPVDYQQIHRILARAMDEPVVHTARQPAGGVASLPEPRGG